jgi:hypothetical protein
MRRALSVLVLVLVVVPVAIAQTLGTVTSTKPTTITAVTTNLRCTITSTDLGAHVSAYCYNGSTLVFNAAIVVLGVTDKPNGGFINYGYLGDSITGMFWRPASGASIQWQVAANSTMKEGVF